MLYFGGLSSVKEIGFKTHITALTKKVAEEQPASCQSLLSTDSSHVALVVAHAVTHETEKHVECNGRVREK